MLQLLDEQASLLKPFHNLWPRYNNIHEFQTDYEYNVYISHEDIPKFIEFTHSFFVETASEQAHIEGCRQVAQQCRDKFRLYSSPVDTKASVIHGDGSTIANAQFERRHMNPSETLSKALSLIFPANFLNNLMNDNCIDVNTANKWILEYRKFLVLAFHSKEMITPSEQVDLVWHMHMDYTQHYRFTCFTFLNKEFKHGPTAGGKTAGMLYDATYGSTTQLYKDIFQMDPPDDVWGSNDVRFDPKKFMFRNVNLFRLATLYSMKVCNPQFLIPTAPPAPQVVIVQPAPAPGVPAPRTTVVPSKAKKQIRNRKQVIRKNRRRKFRNQKKRFGWRKHYRMHKKRHLYSRDSSDELDGSDDDKDKDKSIDDLDNDRSGGNDRDNEAQVERDSNVADYLAAGGLVILGNPFDPTIHENNNLADLIAEGLYDDMGFDNFNDMNLDDIADCAEADIDLVGDPDIAEYAAEFDEVNGPIEMDQDMEGQDLEAGEGQGLNAEDNPIDFNEDLAALDNDQDFDFGAGSVGGKLSPNI